MTSALEQEAAEQGAMPIAATVMRWHMPDDLPYCYIEFDTNVDLKWAMQRYSNVVAAYRKARQANEPQRTAQATPPAQQQRPQTRQNAPQRPQQSQQVDDLRLGHSWGLCPDCLRPSKPSIARYQEWEADDEGNEVPAKHFCPNDNCQTKSLWRRQLVAEEAADSMPF